MSDRLRIGNAHGFWGDRIEAAAEMLAAEPELDFLTFDFLAEVSMSILAAQRERGDGVGYVPDFLDIVRSLLPYWRSGGGCRLVSNAGGLAPAECARACAEILAEAGIRRTVAVVEGDDVLELVRTDSEEEDDPPRLRNLDTGAPIRTILDGLTTAHAYLGADPVAAALGLGADIVITGRVADPSLVVGACLHHFRWDRSDWNRLAGATVAGHLLECGAQVTGGISTDWLEIPDPARIGFPIAELSDDGEFIVTQPRGSGGRVTEASVREQLLYEIGDPDAYLSPDVTVSFLSLVVETVSPDRVAVRGAKGSPPPTDLKVSGTYRDGFWAAGQLTVFGTDAVQKAGRAGEAVLRRLRENGMSFREAVIECVGAGACLPEGMEWDEITDPMEVVLRIAVADLSREPVERFRRALPSLVTAGPQGTTGYAEGRPRVRSLFRFWPCLIERSRVRPRVFLQPTEPPHSNPTRTRDGHPHGGRDGIGVPSAGGGTGGSATPSYDVLQVGRPGWGLAPDPILEARGLCLGDLAHARSGDKGTSANIGVIARRAEDYEHLLREVTAQRVATFLAIADASRVVRHELPNLRALNFVVRGILSSPLRTDAQGKALGQILLRMPLGTPPSGPT